MNLKHIALAALALGCASLAQAHHPHPISMYAQNTITMQGQSMPWHNAHYHTMYGTPIALVVPPTAEYQTNYGWGVGGMRNSPIYPQFTRPYPGPSGGYANYPGFMPTPHWPMDTQQFGVYYIRGPW